MKTADDVMPDARRFWIDFTHGSGLAYYVFARIAEYSSQLRGAALDRKLDELLQKLDYATTIDEVMAAYPSTGQSEPSFWNGDYALFEDGGVGDYRLQITDGRISLRAGELRLDDDPTPCFSDAAFSTRDDRLGFDLRFEVPAGKTAVAQMSGQPRCRGKLHFTDQGQTRSVEVVGKRDCFTWEGVQRVADGDPAAFWSGEYVLAVGDDWRSSDERLYLSARDGAMRVKVRTTRATNVRFVNNRIACDLAGSRQLAGQLLRNLDGRVQFSGAFLDGKTTTPVTGFRIQGGV